MNFKPRILPNQVFDSAKATKYSFATRKLPNDHPNSLLHESYDDWLDEELSGTKGGYVVYGMSKTGKTSMVEESFRRLEKDPILLHGKDLSSVVQFWEIIAESLNMPNAREISSTNSLSHSSEFGIESAGVRIGDSDANSREVSRKEIRGNATLVSIQKELESSGRPLFVDDFHHCPIEVAVEISRELKPVVRNTLVVLIAIPSESFAPVRGTVDNGGRFKPIEISLWSKEELAEIGISGFPYLDYSLSAKSLAKMAAAECFGSPHIMQDLCLQIARYLRGKSIPDLSATRIISELFPQLLRMVAENGTPENFASLIAGLPSKGYARKPSYFNKSIDGVEPGVKFDHYGVALVAFRELCRGYRTTFEVAQIAETLRGMELTPGTDASKVGRTVSYLAKIAEEKKGNLDPMLVHIPESSGDAKGQVQIVDPFLSFYLAYGAWVKDAQIG